MLTKLIPVATLKGASNQAVAPGIIRPLHATDVTRVWEYSNTVTRVSRAAVKLSSIDRSAVTKGLGTNALVYISDGEPIYYHGRHELCIIAGGPQNQLIVS